MKMDLKFLKGAGSFFKANPVFRANPFFLCLLGLLVFFFLGGIILFFVRRGDDDRALSAKSQPKARPVPEKPAVFMHPLFPPALDSPLKDYRLFRPRRERWTEEEAEEWFTVPDDAMLDQLRDANTRMIDNLLETAP